MEKIFWAKIVGVSLILFPLMLLAGFLMHPNILSFKMTTSAADLVAKFRHQWMFHVGHLIVFAAVPFIIASMVYIAGLPVEHGRIWVFFGGIIGVVGAVILAGDKGALCIVLSAFDKLPEPDFATITPALEAIVERKGLLAIFYLLPLLPLGAAAQLVGLIMDGRINPAAGIAAIVGLVLLNNPDIEIISSAGALLMCAGYIPFGLSVI
jgi:hypothetical protein